MPAKYTSKDWDEVRSAFAASLMVNTAMTSLAQNLDGPDWPIKSKEETPSTYIDLTYDELVETLALKGMPPERTDMLIEILKDTLAFDDPFGEMVAQTEADEKKDNQLLKNLNRLEIPAEFPIALTVLDAETFDFCRSERLTTLGEFAVFAQGLAQNVIIGGDFRKLINALSHVDERALAECLPFRPGAKGLHLMEALGQAANSGAPAARAIAVTGWFKKELEELRRDLRAGGSLSRHVMVLHNPALEAKVTELLKPSLVGLIEPEKKTGFFGRFFRK